MSLTLRPRTLADLPDLWHWLHGTPEAEWKRWDAPYFHTDPRQVSLSDYAASALAQPDAPDMRVIDIDGRARGFVTRHWEAPAAGGWLELGIVILDPAYWNGGHGTQALRLWTKLSFEHTHAHVITLTTWSGNARMIRAAQKVGYREYARVREARLWQGERHDSVRLDLLRREWPAAGSEPRQPSAKLPS